MPKPTTPAPTPAHLLPDACYVCGGEPHADASKSGGHNYLSNADAAAYFAAEDRRTRLTETVEARYVRQHRPY